jgi:hypothetical protein
MQPTLADDILGGVKAISEFIGEDERRTYYLLEKRLIDGTFKQGARWVGLKSKIREGYVNKATQGAA